MKKGCLSFVLMFIALLFVYSYGLFLGRMPEKVAWLGALACSFLNVLSGGTLWNALSFQRQSKLIRKCIVGSMPKDEALFAAAGPVRPIRRPLLSPLGGKECVAYSYDVSNGHPSADNSTQMFTGFALVPSTVQTPSGQIKILGFPQLDDFPESLIDRNEGRQRFQSYLQQTSFEEIGVLEISKMIAAVKEMLTDDDGALRKDWRLSNDPLGETSEFSEKVVGIGHPVVVLGKYSTVKGGIIQDVTGSGIPLQIFPGGAEPLARRLQSKAILSALGALLLTVVLIGVTGGIYFYGASL